MDLSVVIPAYREQENLEILLPRLARVLSGMPIRSEVLVVDTIAPLDATEEVCRLQRVRHVRREDGDDYGDAVRTGIRQALGEKILIMDADGSHRPESIPEMYAHALRYDLVIGSRYVRSGRTENSLPSVLMSLAVNLAYRAALGLKVKDVSNSFRIYDGAQLRGVETTCDHFDWVEEALVKLVLRHPGLTIKEVPIEFKRRMLGESKRDLVAFASSYVATMRRLRKMKKEFRKESERRIS